MSSDAILSIKIRELQIQLSRYQTMNYEFSNQALRKKFQSLLYESNDVMDEVRNNSMDSYVLNQKINQEIIHNFIDTLNVSDTIKLELKQWTGQG